MANLLLLLIVVLGALGVYLAMPGGRRDLLRGAFVALAGAGAALVVLLFEFLGGDSPRWVLSLLALLSLWSGLRVVTHPKPVYSALYFVVVAICVAGMLLMMGGQFLAMAVLIIYGGAILVTYVFVIMLAQQNEAEAQRHDLIAREPLLGCVCGFVLLAVIALRLLSPGPIELTAPPAATAGGTVEAVGTLLLTKYILAVEIAGVLLLASMVGAIAIARRKPTSDAALAEEY